jgi:hypothetical protein
VERKNPLGLGLPECPWCNVLLSSWCKPLVSLSPWWGYNIHLLGFSAPWRFDLIIPPYVPVHQAKFYNNKKYALNGIIAMSITSNNQITQTCASNPLEPRQMLKDFIQFNKSGLEKVS